MLKQWIITLDNSDSSLIADEDARIALFFILSCGWDRFSAYTQAAEQTAKIAQRAKAQADHARN